MGYGEGAAERCVREWRREALLLIGRLGVDRIIGSFGDDLELCLLPFVGRSGDGVSMLLSAIGAELE